MICPRCKCELIQYHYQNKIISFSCPECYGQALTIGALRTLGVEEENTRSFWIAASKGKLGAQLSCPECSGEMRMIKVDDGQCKFFIDLCLKCQLLWFDTGELEKIPVNSPQNDDMSQRTKEILAANAINTIRTHDDGASSIFRNRSGWYGQTSDNDTPFDIPDWLLMLIKAAVLIIKVIR